MVEKVVDDGVEPKVAIIEAFLDFKHIIEASVYVKISTQTSVEANTTGVSNVC